MLSASIVLSQTLFSAVYLHSPRGRPEWVPISCLCASGSPLMAKRWYIIHAYSNFETKVADAIREQAKHRHLDHLFEEIVVPTEKL